MGQQTIILQEEGGPEKLVQPEPVLSLKILSPDFCFVYLPI